MTLRLCNAFALLAISWIAFTTSSGAATYQVGPTRTYHTVGALPALTAGDVVEVDPAIYNEVKRWTVSGTVGKPGPFGFIYEPDPAEPAGSQRGFDGWGQSGRIVNISYEYRVSLPETTSALLKEAIPRTKLTQVGSMALVADLISYGAGRFSHGFKYQFVRGDGSVDVFKDKGSPPLWQEFGLSPAFENDAMFLVLDHPYDYKTFLRGEP